MPHSVLLRGLMTGKHPDEEHVPTEMHPPRPRRIPAGRRHKTVKRSSTLHNSTAEGNREIQALSEPETDQVRRLLDDFAPENEEPVHLARQLEEHGISPIEMRLRSRSARPVVASVPADTHASALQPGGNTVLLTP